MKEQNCSIGAKDDFAILILSCDKYSDLWDLFFGAFWKNFPDCDVPVYLGCNFANYHDSRVTVINANVKTNWSGEVKSILQQVKEKYLFIWLEDLLITSPISREKLLNYVQFMKERDAKHIKLGPYPEPDSVVNDGIGVYEKGVPYRASAMGLWDRDYLLNFLLLDGENPWQFEVMGSYRTSYSDGFFGLRQNLFERLNLLVKGKWSPRAIQYFKKNNVEVDISKHPPMSLFDIGLYLAGMILLYPLRSHRWWRIRVKIMNTLRYVIFDTY